jgi:PIN domain nuclease of toxin-antitoxin system
MRNVARGSKPARTASCNPDRVFATRRRAIDDANQVAAAAYSWWELAWAAKSGRIGTRMHPSALIAVISRSVLTVPLTPAIAAAAAQLPRDFPSDPGDRLIYATAVEHGWKPVSKDARLRAADTSGNVVIW